MIRRLYKTGSGMLTVLLLSSALLLAAQKPATSVPIATPAAKDILSRVKKSHPRLLMANEDFARLRQNITTDETLKRWFEKVKSTADKILREAPSKYEIPDGLRLLSTSRRVVDRVYTLGLMYRLTGDRRYADRAWDELKAASEFKDWNPKHFLDTGEMCHAFGIGYDWLHDFWSPEQKTVLRTAIIEKGLKVAIECHRGTAPKGVSSFWAKCRHNWNQVCNGGIGVGALAIADEQPALAGEFLEAALRSIQLAMTEYGPDGAWGEGPGYWGYATSYNVCFLAGLETACGTDFNLSSIKGFSEAGSFPIFTVGPSGKSFSYADAHEGSIKAACLLWLAKKFNRPDFARFQVNVSSGTAQDMIWFDPRMDLKNIKQAPLDKYFQGCEVMTLRGPWDDKNSSFVAYKAGDNKVNHSHLDIGSFAIDALGERWASDLGGDNYNYPGYFGKQRWDYYRLRAEGHNTLVINPGKEPDQDPKAATRIVKFQSSPNFSFGISDLTAAYAKNASAVQRGVALLARKQILIQDEVKLTKPGDLWWFMHTLAKIEVTGSGNIATLAIGGKNLQAKILQPANARFIVMEAKPLPTSPAPEKQGNNSKGRKLTIQLRSISDARIAVLFTPMDGVARPAVETRVTPLAAWVAR